MSRMVLSLETLNEFDFGKAAVMFRQALRSVVGDILDRPGEKKARKVVLEVHVAPVLLQDGDVVDANVMFLAKTVLPAWHTSERPVGVTKKGELFFSVDAPDNPRQRTIRDGKEE